MKSQVRIILESGSSNKAKGNAFEDMIRSILESHQYNVKGNINYSGMEIDLIATHKHKSELLYVECKAKPRVSSDELSKFCFNVDFKKADAGYFFRTEELEYQAGALLDEIRKDDRYKNLTFFEPSDIIQILIDNGRIIEPFEAIDKLVLSKRILVVSYFGNFMVYLVNDNNVYPTKFIARKANRPETPISNHEVDLLKGQIDELLELEIINDEQNSLSDLGVRIEEPTLETISEVQESDNWYDYLPASSMKNHFIGRDRIRTSIMRFLKEIRSESTNKRLFYLSGKSGWGKSSLVVEIKGRCHNKHFKNRFYTVAIDTRSATSSNFVALSLMLLIEKAFKDKFLSHTLFASLNINFTSNFDLLSSEYMKKVNQELAREDKYLILIFDQFEDVFRKKELFKSFYKFLSDVTNSQFNFIVGFSWRSEIIIPIDHEAYFYWQQAKEQARLFTVEEFGEKEIDGIIDQLEQSIGKVDNSIKSRIKESSQGLPWLTKKLCIHIYQQVQRGIPKEDLVDSNLNIETLFREDEERVEGKELQALRLIAKRAYDGNFFDETEVGELIDTNTVQSLLHKRLIIRSGANYNIYWDIFRDYLVTGEIPIIGESYLIRHMVSSSMEAFLCFKKLDTLYSLEELKDNYPKNISEDGLYNILIELRTLGLVQKISDKFKVGKIDDISEVSFKVYVTDKFRNYTPYLKLKKLENKVATKEDFISVLKDTFKQDFQENTWNAYANTILSWVLYVDPDIGIISLNHRTNNFNLLKDIDKLVLRHSPNQLFSLLPFTEEEIKSLDRKFLRDLVLLGIVNEEIELTETGQVVVESNINE